MNIAMYLRLSDDDADISDKKLESHSISAQRIIVRNFINNNSAFKNADIIEYCDDGYSGVNFNRPNVIKLLDDVKKGIINCIVVKDLSRFGRNLVEVGNYLEQIFPVLDVRFIAINDNYDSINNNDYSKNIEIAFKNLMNEAYSRDISTKIKSTKTLNKKQGTYLGGIVPYGYKVINKNLVIDDYAANIVREIFKMAEKNISFINIAKYLNSKGILTRSEYSGKAKTKHLWKARNISNLLHNEVYIGTMILNRQESIAPRVLQENSKTDWLVFKNHHEPIINIETFENVKKTFNKSSLRTPMGSFYPEFKGKVYCKGCGQLLSRHYTKNLKTGKTFFYKCDYGEKANCCSDKFFIEKLKHIIVSSIEAYTSLVISNINDLKRKNKEEHKTSEIEITALNNEISLLEKKVLSEYANYSSGSITRVEFSSIREKITDKIFILNSKKEALEQKSALPTSVAETENLINNFSNSEIISDEMIKSLVKKIYISSNNKIEIEWNFREIPDKSYLF